MAPPPFGCVRGVVCSVCDGPPMTLDLSYVILRIV